MKVELKKKDKSIQRFNMGKNSGKIASQTMLHCHIHLIPRRKDDIENHSGDVKV